MLIFQSLMPLFNFSTVENEVIVYQKVTGFASVFSVKNNVFRKVSSLSPQRAVLNLSLLTPSGRGKGYMVFEKNEKFLRKFLKKP